MKWHRIYAIMLRHLYTFRRSLDRLTDSFYWPSVDLILWGLTSKYYSSVTSDTTIIFSIITGLVLWYILWRGELEVTMDLLEEMWSKNLVNIFVSPLKFSEWITSFLILSIIKATLSFSFAAILAFILYKVELFKLGIHLLPFILLLLLSGWAIGFLVAGLVLRFGSRIQSLAWTSIWIFSPFAAVYYPLSILPEWAQMVARFLPMSYVFEGAREVITIGVLDPQKIVYSLGLNIIYIAIGFWFIHSSFRKVMKKGLVKVD